MAPHLEVRHFGLHIRLLLPHRPLVAEHGTAAATTPQLILNVGKLRICKHFVASVVAYFAPAETASLGRSYAAPSGCLAVCPGALLVVQALRRGARLEGGLCQRRRVRCQSSALSLGCLALRPDVVARRTQLGLSDLESRVDD